MKSNNSNKTTLFGLIFKAGVTASLLAAVPAAIVAAEKAEGAGVTAPAAAVRLSGTVIDASTGLPMAGSRISVVNSSETVLTDDEGHFNLNVPVAGVTLVASAPGYNTVYVPMSGREGADIKLSPSTGNTLYDGILSVGASTPSGLGLGRTTADNSVVDLQGSLLSISRSGMPGSGHSVYIDGIHSLNTSSQPLYIVDGVEWTTVDAVASAIDGHFNNPLALISPDDIESISVLKNGTALYGAKGGNGVVVINTRRAHSEATEIEAFARMGWRDGIKSIPVMDATQYRLYASDIIKGKYANSTLIDRLSFLNDDVNSSQYAVNHNNTDWLDLISRKGLVMDYGVNVRGGDDRALYAFMLGYTRNEGPVKDTDFDRINIRFNSDINLWKGVKMRFNVAYAQVDYNMFDDGINAVSSPYYLSLIKSPLYHSNVLTSAGDVTLKYADVDELGVGNPMNILDLGKGENRNYRFNLNVAPRYDISNSLAVEGLVAYSFDKVKENTFIPDYGVADRDLVNDNGEVYNRVKNTVQNVMNRHTMFRSGIHVDYRPLRGVIHDLALKGGFAYQNDTYITSRGLGYNTSSDFIQDLANASVRETSGFDTEWRNMQWFVSGEYSLLNRYQIGADISLESNSRFGHKAPGALRMGGVAWGLFPSVNLGWILSSESWMARAPWLNLLKIRAGWEMAGNDNLPFFANRTYFDSNHFLGNGYGSVLANIGNDRLKWETTSSFKAGVDMSLFNDRWQWSLDFFTSKTRDLIVSKPLDEQSGLMYYWANGGDLRNRGINFSTTVRAVNTRDWKLDLGASIGHYKNEVTKLADGSFTTDVDGATILTSVGNPVGVFYGYRTEGVFSTPEEAAAANLSIRNPNGSYTAFEAGDMHFADNEADGVINERDRQIIGDPNPDFYGNFNFRLQWKNLSLRSLFTYSVGNDVYNALRANLESGSDIFNQSTAMTNRWVANGQVTDIPRATYGDPMGNSRFSDRWIEDGSYLKWKSLAIDYRIPVRSPYIQGVTVSFEVNNLATWTKYLGRDPEFSYGTSPLYMGIDAGLIPQSREYVFGVKVNL